MPATTAKPAPARAGAGQEEARRPSVLAIVVSHRGRRWLKDCLVSLNSQTYDLLDVLVVDDASPDFRTPPHLKRVCKRHLRRRRWGWVRTPRALGFGGASNWALGRVRTDADLFLFVHDDTVLEEDAVAHMVAEACSDEDTAIVGPKIVSYDDPDRLEEIGMAVDRFGYPYKGLEEGEIDLGQHDSGSEVFYVTSTCLMIRHEVFSDLGGWDAGMRAFSEDLDLCWRARIAGYGVRVEPAARVRHAIALARGERESPFVPARYYIRRNRLRAVIKNVSAPRLIALAPQLLVLAVAEMLGFLLLRLPSESLSVFRALIWNLGTLPRAFADRSKVQAIRTVKDGRLRRLTVRESTRLHAYAEHQAARMEEAWGRRAEVVAERGRSARRATGSLAGARGFILTTALLLLLLGFRNALWSAPVAAGDLLPFPGRAPALLGTYLSPWLHSGLGHPWPSPPAFGILGWFSMLTLGDAGGAQKLALVVFGVTAFIGAYRLVGESVDRTSRLVAGAVYLLGGVGYAGMRNGHLGALMVGAVAPFVIHPFLAFIGWQRPPAFRRGKVVAQAALAGAVGASMVPGSLVFFGAGALVLAAVRSVADRPLRALAGLGWSLLALVCAWALLLPWSLTWFDHGGALDVLMGSGTRATFTSDFSGAGMLTTMLGQTPFLPAFAGFALPIAGLVALFVARDQRFRLALALWGIVVATGWLIQATASGLLPPLVASPIEAGVIAALAFAGLAGLASSAIRLDLRSASLGYRQPLALGAGAAAVALALTGLVPALLGGQYSLKPAALHRSERMTQAGSLLTGQKGGGSEARILWVGPSWQEGPPTGLRPPRDYVLTGRDGETFTDLFENDTGPGPRQLASAIAAIELGRVDLGGDLLGAFNIGWVVVARESGAAQWLGQRDLTVLRSDPGYELLQNGSYLARAGLYPKLPPELTAVSGVDPAALASKPSPLVRSGVPSSPHAYSIKPVTGPAVAFLAESRDPGWQATADGRSLQGAGATWGNDFEVPAGAGGKLDIVFHHPVAQILWLITAGVGWLVALGVSFARSGHRGASA